MEVANPGESGLESGLWNVFTLGELLNHSAPPPPGTCGAYVVALVKCLIQCLVHHGCPTEDTLGLPKTFLMSSHIPAQGRSWACYCPGQSVELRSCGLIWVIDVFCLVHIEISNTLSWLSVFKIWESS